MKNRAHDSRSTAAYHESTTLPVAPEAPPLVREESLWFGETERPLFGRLTLPIGDTARGGVLISPPLGREGRLARRALRTLSILLALDGFVTLRFDHYGTGDSSGSLSENESPSSVWCDGVNHGVSLLRSLGVTTVSAIGLRMGATILGDACALTAVEFSSVVLWDPCETGRSFLRELTALGALRLTTVGSATEESAKFSEYVFGGAAVERIEKLTLRTPLPVHAATRILVVTREDRRVSNKFRQSWESPRVEWISSSEIGSMLDTELPSSVEPTTTIDQIRRWLNAPSTASTAVRGVPKNESSIVQRVAQSLPVRESLITLGPQKMFGVLSEPEGGSRGPLIVMVNGINEDHVGPSRLWVELSRRWASEGLRCLRFDLNEFGESPWIPGQPDRRVYDKSRAVDLKVAISSLTPALHEDAVLIGLCSGAQLALDVALEQRCRGFCAINPQVGSGITRSANRLEKSDHAALRALVRRGDEVLKRHRWIGQVVWQVSRLVVKSPYSRRVKSALLRHGCETLLLLSPEELSPFPWIPILGTLDRRRVVSSEHCRIEIVPEMDHDFLNSKPRVLAVEILFHHVVENFASPTAL